MLRAVVPGFVFSFYHLAWSFFSSLFYLFPGCRLKVIGITGTNGKSTVVYLIGKIFEEAGFPFASASSIEFKINGQSYANNLKMTMPGRGRLQGFLRRAVKKGCRYCVLEVTSEGIKQHRHRFIGFDAALLTNLTPEHLENHGGMEAYKKAKGKLFKKLKKYAPGIVNLDDKEANYFLSLVKNKWGYGIEKNNHPLIKEKEKIIYCSSRQTKRNGVSFEAEGTKFDFSLLGRFNLYNALAAIAVCRAEGIDLSVIKCGLEKADAVPGRLEIVFRSPFTVIVDYAHTPDALESVYQTIKESFSSANVIGVLGAAGGGRDKWKRPVLGKIAEKYCDAVVLTNEDPYDEDPKEIIDQIAQTIKKKPVEKIIDRKEAIRKAFSLAQEGDVVVITGKGCEPWMCFKNGQKIPWDDRQIAQGL